MADEEKVYEIRCPVCGYIFTYKMGNVQFDEKYPIGYVECPACKEHVQHTLGYVKEDNR